MCFLTILLEIVQVVTNIAIVRPLAFVEDHAHNVGAFLTQDVDCLCKQLARRFRDVANEYGGINVRSENLRISYLQYRWRVENDMVEV